MSIQKDLETMKNLDRNTVVVAMSGGVDSSVAAILLKEQGYNVIGMTMKLWDYEGYAGVGGNINQESGCCSIDSFNDARRICGYFDFPYYLVNFSREFHKEVITDFIDEYIAGRTPNPCVLCNTKIKWETFLSESSKLNSYYMATGHYAEVVYNNSTGRYELHKGEDDKKDQSYALWGLKQESLARTVFPLAKLKKDEVRKIAEKNKIITAQKPESQEICFVPDNNYHRFLKENVKNLEKQVANGPIKTTDGKTVGHHKGYPFYTIGQRRGLGMGFGKPVYVVSIDADTNTVVIGNKDDLNVRGLRANNLNLIKYEKLTEPLHALIKIRYNDTGRMGTVIQKDKNNFEVIFDEPSEAVTPGQSVVFYVGIEVVGGGIIQEKIL